MQLTIPDEALRAALKSTLTEMLQQRDAAIMEVLAELLEEAALGHAMREGDQHDLVPATDVWQALQS